MKRATHFVGESYEQLYHEILKEIDSNPEFTGEARGSGFKEISNLSFELTDPSRYKIRNPERDFNFEFANRFFDWMMSGDSDISKLTGVNKNAKNFMAGGELPDSFNTAYGPRLKRQLPRVISLLRQDPGTRRAVIHILEESDKVIWDVDTKMEYPCTHAYQFMVRDGKLNLYVLMRSNNMVLTVCYDVWNTANLLAHVAEELGIKAGSLHFNCTSAHFFDSEQKLVTKILNRYDEAVLNYNAVFDDAVDRLSASIDQEILRKAFKDAKDEHLAKSK